MTLLSVAIPTFDDYRGLSMTIQSLNMHHADTGLEITVFDNFGCKKSKDFCEKANVRYVADNKVQGTCYAKDRVIRETTGKWTLLMDSHVLVGTNGITDLKKHLAALPEDCNDMFHGVLLSNKGKVLATEMKNEWSSNAMGKWHERTEGGKKPLPDEPVEIWGHGCALMCIRKSTWPGYHPRCTGFGGEEGAIQERYRSLGRKVLLLPFLKWTHSFNDSTTVSHKITAEDKFRNYLLNLGGMENSTKLWSDCILHFTKSLNMETIKRVCAECLPDDVEITNSIGVIKK
jgi:hypothetical protein